MADFPPLEVPPYDFEDEDEDEDEDPAGRKCEITTYDCLYTLDGKRTILHTGAKGHLRPPRERDHDSALVLTRFYDKERVLEKTELLIRSPYIKQALRDIIKTYPEVNIHSNQVVITDIPKCLFHYRNELKEYRLKLDNDADKKRVEHLDFLSQYMDTTLYISMWTYFDNVEMSPDPATTGLEFLDLWMAYRPSDLLYTKINNIDFVMRLKSMDRCACLKPYCPRRSWRLTMEQIAYDGEKFGYTETWVRIAPYDGHKAFRKLKAYPLHYHENEQGLREALIERGKRFVALRGAHHQSYEGVAEALSVSRMTGIHGEEDFFPLQSLIIKGRVMIDAKKFGTMFPGNSVDLEAELDLEKVSKESDRNGEPNFFEEDFLICKDQMPGFALSTKRWCFFRVNLVKEPTFNNEAFESLILHEDQKKLVHSLVNVHANEQLKFDDLIKGKGKGMIFLLHGAPGTGKTLTAESIADFTKRPLYTISSGDLGTDAQSMELHLSKALQLAEGWRAIVLIDEADIFLEQRSAHDLKRNGLVSVFLRLLEYFEGILFLTTNRIGAFDEAFQSRIHLAIRYPALSIKDRGQLWSSFITKTYPDENLPWINKEALDGLGAIDLNGREIKNAFRTAHALAVSSGKSFSREHIDLALKGMQRFKDELRKEAAHVTSGSETEQDREMGPRKRRRQH